jgi:hypothetical protein
MQTTVNVIMDLLVPQKAGISLYELLSASQEGLSFMEIVGFSEID